jgi:hypothetical protein
MVVRSLKMIGNLDFIDWKAIVNNLRTRVNMLSSKLQAQLRKTFVPTKLFVVFYRFKQIEVDWIRLIICKLFKINYLFLFWMKFLVNNASRWFSSAGQIFLGAEIAPKIGRQNQVFWLGE